MECDETLVFSSPKISPTRVEIMAQENSTLEKKDKIMDNHNNQFLPSPIGEEDILVLADLIDESHENFSFPLEKKLLNKRSPSLIRNIIQPLITSLILMKIF
jgi:hypothetical protein